MVNFHLDTDPIIFSDLRSNSPWIFKRFIEREFLYDIFFYIEDYGIYYELCLRNFWNSFYSISKKTSSCKFQIEVKFPRKFLRWIKK